MARALPIAGQLTHHRARCTNTAGPSRLPDVVRCYLMFALHADIHAVRTLLLFHCPATPHVIVYVSLFVCDCHGNNFFRGQLVLFWWLFPVKRPM